MKALIRITQNPWGNLLVAIILIITTGQQVWTDMMNLDKLHLSSHHGVFILGLFNGLKTLPGIIGNLTGIEGSVQTAEKI